MLYKVETSEILASSSNARNFNTKYGVTRSKQLRQMHFLCPINDHKFSHIVHTFANVVDIGVFEQSFFLHF